MGIRFTRNGIWLGQRGRGRVRKLPLSRLLALLSVLVLVVAYLTTAYSTRDANLIPIFSVDGPAREPVSELVVEDLKSMALSLIEADSPPQNERLDSYRLMVDENAIPELLRAELERRESGGERTYYPAMLWSPQGGWQRSKISIRGASAWHHTPEKPSLRVKVARADQAGRRFLEISRPEDPLALCNWLPEQIGESLGLMSARTKPVRLYLNSKHMGLYLDTYRLGEPLALANRRLPGTFFQGENVDGEVTLWSEPSLWESRGEQDPEAEKRFHSFLRLIGGWMTTPENVLTLFEFVDSERLAAWCALLTFSSSYHSDDFHNQIFFYNTYRGLLEPVVWDMNGFGVLMEATADPDLTINLIQSAAYADPRFLYLRNQYLWRLLEDSETIQETARTGVERLMPDLQADTSLGGLGRLWPEAPAGFPFHIAAQMVFRRTEPSELPRHRREFDDFYAQRMSVLRDYFRQADFQVESKGSGSRIRVFGRVAIEVRSGNGDLIFSGLNYNAGTKTLLYPGRRSGEKDQSLLRPISVLRPAPLVYDLDNPPQDLSFFHAHSGEPVEPSGVVPSGRSDSIHPAYFFPKPGRIVELGPGVVELKEDLILEVEDTLRVAPETKLRLGPGVQIVCFGKVDIRASKASPVIVEPLQEGKAWGSLSFVGQQELNLSGLQVTGGSISRHRGYAFKGMFNAYQVGRVKLQDCRFLRNEVGDDAVNIANSEVDVQRCEFVGARSDALDLDRCRGAVSDSRFVRAGNDGLDLSHAELQVSNCEFLQCGDKGVSVGEKSTVELRALEIRKCVIGIQCKDESVTRLSESSLTDNGLALSAYRKKRIFTRGGTILYRGLQMSSNGKKIDEQERSVVARVKE